MHSPETPTTRVTNSETLLQCAPVSLSTAWRQALSARSRPRAGAPAGNGENCSKFSFLRRISIYPWDRLVHTCHCAVTCGSQSTCPYAIFILQQSQYVHGNTCTRDMNSDLWSAKHFPRCSSLFLAARSNQHSRLTSKMLISRTSSLYGSY